MKRNLLFLFAITIVCFIANTANAQRPRHGKHPHHAKNPEMRKEIRAYTRENILPTLREQRLKLDSYLTEAEKTEIAQLRQQFKAHRKSRHQKDEKALEATDLKPLREKLKAIAQKYETQIDKLREEIAPKMKNWKADMEKIASKHLKPEEMEHAKHKMGKQWRMRGIAFLLMPTEEPEDRKESKKQASEAVDAFIYPNPTQETQQLKIKIKEAGKVKITLFDRQGNVVQNVFEGEKTAGEHIFDINISKLSTGNYTYQISTPTGQTTKKLIKK